MDGIVSAISSQPLNHDKWSLIHLSTEFSSYLPISPSLNVCNNDLSPRGDFAEGSYRLFKCLRECEEVEDGIVCLLPLIHRFINPFDITVIILSV